MEPRIDTDQDDFVSGRTRSGDSGLERDYDNLPAGYDRDDQSRTGTSSRWIGPFFGDHMRPPTARRPGGLPPRGYRHGDARLYEEVNERLGASTLLDAEEIDVRVEGGVVTLSGTVPYRRHKRIAEFIALSVPGVDDVHNRIRVTHPT